MTYAQRLINCMAHAVSGDEEAEALFRANLEQLNQQNIDRGIELTISDDAVVIVAGVSQFGAVFCNIHTLH